MVRVPMIVTIEDAEREIQILKQRLDDGEKRIAEAKGVGADVESWEAFWIELLNTYNDICERHKELLRDRG